MMLMCERLCAGVRHITRCESVEVGLHRPAFLSFQVCYLQSHTDVGVRAEGWEGGPFKRYLKRPGESTTEYGGRGV